MDVVDCLRKYLVQRLEHRNAKAEIVHEVAIHHVKMDHVRTGVQNTLAVLAKACKIGGKDRGADLCHNNIS